MTKMNKHTLLKGEGINQHTLYGDFKIEEKQSFSQLVVTKVSVLRHETPTGEFAEHKPLSINKGKWTMGRQVEFNPFENRVSMVWD
jgi:hypothetical protein